MKKLPTEQAGVVSVASLFGIISAVTLALEQPFVGFFFALCGLALVFFTDLPT